MTALTAATLVAHVDHTLLKPEAATADFDSLVAHAQQMGVLAVCVSPSALPLTDTGDLVVATVCGFPSGAVKSEVKAAEAARAVADGAREVDMVVNVGLIKDGAWDAVEEDIRGVVGAVAGAARDLGLPEATGPEAAVTGSAIVKVILETAALTPDEIVEACRRAEAAGAHYVKTSTGFHPAGGASAEAVALMRETVGDRLGVRPPAGSARSRPRSRCWTRVPRAWDCLGRRRSSTRSRADTAHGRRARGPAVDPLPDHGPAACHRIARLMPAVARTPKVTPHRMMPTVCQTMTAFRLAPKPTSVGAVRWLGSAH